MPRFNYIAQPGDKGVRFIRQMGPYDHYAVNWGYRVKNSLPKQKFHFRQVDSGKREIQCISLVSKAVVLIQLHKRKT
jgi:hypothetical protein